MKRIGAHPSELGPPSSFAMLPWLLLGTGALSTLFQGGTPYPWIGAIGLLVFNTLYVNLAFRAFDKTTREAPATRWLLLALAVVGFGLAAGYGGAWLLFFPLLGLATGTVLRGRQVKIWIVLLTVGASGVAFLREGWGAVGIAYGTFISGMVSTAILALSEAVGKLLETRQELARIAVEKERLRFSRDLHDLLGHTLSVIVVKSEVARRLGPKDMEAALAEIADIESVGRQALTEIREAVTGYREGTLTTELDRARLALTASGIEPVVHQSGTPLAPQTAALLGWVVREAVTNAVRHSAATTCEITVRGTADRARVTVVDDGVGVPPADGRAGDAPFPTDPADPASRADGTGLRGLAERLAAVGGSLEAGPLGRGGFRVSAELPMDDDPMAFLSGPRAEAIPGAARSSAAYRTPGFEG
ncbi:two-component sensor histidine kinase [Streptomyces inusitatus]|uniref:Two-component sensor histidine kinase n=2 Tax=Streptomyces inusitatus TaxID=68221 RepID=A0A918PUT2_9ACTN|nr:two-component sensor histidine kinase [Streptomyces inusitatus]